MKNHGAFAKLASRLNLSEREKITVPVAIILMIVAAGLRTQPHLANSTPFFAIAIMIGFLLGAGRSLLAGTIAVAAMFLGDLVIGLHATAVFVYVGVAIAAVTGVFFSNLILRQPTWLRRGAWAFVASGLASLVFFIVSNLGVWLVGGIYDRTVEGLGMCFLMAIPFFRTSLATDLLFGTTFILVATQLLLASAKSSPGFLAKVNHGR